VCTLTLVAGGFGGRYPRAKVSKRIPCFLIKVFVQWSFPVLFVFLSLRCMRFTF